jgi:hypothetical protein
MSAPWPARPFTGVGQEWLLRVDSRGWIRALRTAGIGTKPGVLNHGIERQDGGGKLSFVAISAVRPGLPQGEVNSAVPVVE